MSLTNKKELIKHIKQANRWVGRNIGKYNHYVIECCFCHKQIFICEDDNVGFGEPSFMNMVSNTIAIVAECNNCGARQWSHGDGGSFRRWQRWNNKFDKEINNG